MEKQKNNWKFIDEPIQVGYQKEHLLKKIPVCPDYILWRGDRFDVEYLVSQWSDLSRRGLKSRNMRPAHLDRAEKKGSWGVGRFFFQITLVNRRQFVIYYDRTPRKGDEGCGQWILLYEIPLKL